MAPVFQEGKVSEPEKLAVRVLIHAYAKLHVPVKIEDVLGCYDLKLIGLDLAEDDGFLLQARPTGGVVFVNSQHHMHRQRFTAGHELYHHITGDRDERSANIFSASILMPSTVTRKIWEDIRCRPEPRAWAVRLFPGQFGVSPTAAMIRLKKLGLY